MAHCPRCGKEITHLKYKTVSVVYSTYTLETLLKPRDHETERYTFCCPECNKQLYNNRIDAYNLLKGGT